MTTFVFNCNDTQPETCNCEEEIAVLTENLRELGNQVEVLRGLVLELKEKVEAEHP